MLLIRILSGIWTILVIAPLHIVITIIKFLFVVANFLNYYNFFSIPIPEELLNQANAKYGNNKQTEIVLRIVLILFSSWNQFIAEIKLLKTCKF